jgi:hypothetical protein
MARCVCEISRTSILLLEKTVVIFFFFFPSLSLRLGELSDESVHLRLLLGGLPGSLLPSDAAKILRVCEKEALRLSANVIVDATLSDARAEQGGGWELLISAPLSFHAFIFRETQRNRGGL